MKIIKTQFEGLKIIKNPKIYDNRGYFREISLEKLIKKRLKFNYTSLSKKNVVRGLHLQNKKKQAKLVTVLSGKIFDIALDLRKKSKTFGKYFSIFLSEKDDTSLFIPEGFAHGFMSLSKNTLLLYQCSNYRDKKSEFSINWNDKDLNIKWPKINKKIISNKDNAGISLKDFFNKIK